MRNMISIRILFLTIVFSIFEVSSYTGGNTYAQNARTFATGTVVDEQGQPIPGVNVLCQNSNYGTTTTIDGTFKIQTKGKNPVLEFSFIGFQKQEITIKDPKKLIKVVMIEDGYMLDETVVIGYGTQTKRTITSAMTSIKSEELSGYVGSSIEQTISGLVPGVRIQTSDATPGGDINVEVRGIGTVTAGSEPLYIVDGIPMEGGLSAVNPDDVANIQILKDAASTAVYGSRGANGVILITTKRGESTKPTVTINASTTIAQIQHKFELMNTAQLLEYYKDKNLNERFRYTTNQNQDYFPFDENLNTDWQDAIFQNAIQQKYNLSIAGGGKNMRYRISGEYFDQEGILICTGMKRFAFRSNFDIELNKWAKVTVNFAPTFINQKRTREGGEGSNSVIRTAISMYPFFPVKLPNGDYFSTLEYNLAPTNIADSRDPETGAFPTLSDSPLADNQDNPVRIAHEYKNETSQNRIIGGLNFELKLAKGLTFKPSLAIDFMSSENSIWYPASIGKNRTDSEASTTMTRKLMWINENILTYQKEFGDHNISAVGGVTIQSNQLNKLYTSAYHFATESLPSINGGVVNGGSYDKTEDRMLSYIARLTYDYKRKYMIQGVFRADGSSRFGKNNKYGYFPSISAGWAMTEEKFMKPLKKVLSELKLRGSFGLSGNNAIGDYNYETKMSQQSYIVDGSVVSGWAPSNIANPDLKWEVKRTFNTGIDAGFFDNRFILAVDYYNSKTDDMLYLYDVSVPPFAYNKMLANLGSMRNSGVELGIGVTPLRTKDMELNINVNVTFQRNKLLSLSGYYKGEYMSAPEYTSISDLNGAGFHGGYNHIVYQMVGQPLGVFYLPKCTGLVSDGNGGYKYEIEDLNGNGVSLEDGEDRYIAGQAMPKTLLGSNISFRYKQFDLSVQINGAFGHKIYNGTSLTYMNMDIFPDYNVLREAPSLNIQDQTATDYWLEKGDYINFDYLTLGWNVPLGNLRKYVRNVRLSVSVNNLATITGYSGLTPMINSSIVNNTLGIDDKRSYPVVRSYTMGLSFNF